MNRRHTRFPRRAGTLLLATLTMSLGAGCAPEADGAAGTTLSEKAEERSRAQGYLD